MEGSRSRTGRPPTGPTGPPGQPGRRISFDQNTTSVKKKQYTVQLKEQAKAIVEDRRKLAEEPAISPEVSWGAITRADAQGGDGSDSGCFGRTRRRIADLGPLLRNHPETWAVPLLITLLLAAVGVTGVLLAARGDEQRARVLAQGFAENVELGIHATMELATSPLLALATQVDEHPSRPEVDEWFEPFAEKVLAALPKRLRISSLQLAPQGVVTYIYPRKGNEVAFGINLMKDPKRRPPAVETIVRGNMTMQGPVRLVQGFNGVFFRIPIFHRAFGNMQTPFGFPEPAYGCPLQCFNPTTRSRFWGFATVTVDVTSLIAVSDVGTDTRLLRLGELGYAYELFAPTANGSKFVIARSPSDLINPVTTIIPVAAMEAVWWHLLVAPARGWVPAWRAPMTAVAAVASAAIGALSAVILCSRRRLMRLVKKLQATNTELANEKERMDVLLARQLNLISCALGQRGGTGSDSIGAMSSDKGNAKAVEEEALDQIDAMRRSLQLPSTPNMGQEDLQLLELLGEGAFGKVYKGLWRGSTVAIKCMILPARMSGAEKRERMALMEAAISSVVQHPNIVQTYTYTIKPSTSSHLTTFSAEEIGMFSIGMRKRLLASTDTPSTTDPFPASSHIHNFEVCLVLEYCEMGSLRDALDAGAFLLEDGTINYAAVLDMATDVARAMLHLHKQQIIHSDLKARNVLLKRDGASGSGVIGKVADFGLSVRIDAGATHVSEFQGTVSHMAPETQLQRRITRASDVYSFGITLWELYTGGHAFKGVPVLLLPHKVSVQGTRPEFPQDAPQEYRALAEACWGREWAERPSFHDILVELQRLRKRIYGATPPLRPYAVQSHANERQALLADEEPLSELPENSAPHNVSPWTTGHAPNPNGTGLHSPAGLRPPPQGGMHTDGSLGAAARDAVMELPSFVDVTPVARTAPGAANGGPAPFRSAPLTGANGGGPGALFAARGGVPPPPLPGGSSIGLGGIGSANAITRTGSGFGGASMDTDWTNEDGFLEHPGQSDIEEGRAAI